MLAHQKRIRDERAASDPRPVLSTLDGCLVVPVEKDRAQPLILAYEWLGTLPEVPAFQYGLVDSEGELIGVAMFGRGNGTAARMLCGKENAGVAICLERGCCTHWAPPNAASFLISRACRRAYIDHGYQIFYAYCDVEAAEVGTVYQAANWLYTGQGTAGRVWRYAGEGSSRSLRRRGEYSVANLQRKELAKHRYVWLEGSQRHKRKLRAALKYPVLAYPKRAGR